MNQNELEARVLALEAKVRHSDDVLAIMNLQSRYNYYLELNYTDRVPLLFAQKDPAIQCEICDGGVFIGMDSIKRLWRLMGEGQSARGFLGTIMISTPHIQVAKDGKTAKGMWHAFGPNSVPATSFPADHDHQDQLTAIWFLGKYNNEYVKEDGKWKFWSLQVVVYVRAPYEHGWIKQPNARMFGLPPSIAKPDKPSTVFKPYHPHGFNLLLPEPPDEIE
jgi:hypothetical protein